MHKASTDDSSKPSCYQVNIRDIPLLWRRFSVLTFSESLDLEITSFCHLNAYYNSNYEIPYINKVNRDHTVQ